MGQTPDEIRNDIEVTRAELRDDVDRIADRASPKRMAQRRTEQVRDKARGLKERVMGRAPDRDTFREAGHSVQDRAGAATENVRSGMGQATENVRSGMGQATETVKSMPGQAAQRTQGNPLAAGLIAFGAGLLVASLISDSQTERQAARRIREQMGDAVEPVRQSLTESAERVRDDARESAQQAAGQIKETATQAGQETREAAQQETQRSREQMEQTARSGSGPGSP
ncbi:DUF3618 domain-containing protein [Thermobifida halotolerans]|uniref:DUF3618 domain-containing protein n=1 Tax=Thermobifida halotolerans TaxID=483545 RepID=A0A399FVC7_9ACTN|nr:DUF3618 domain-containing protein [Thermobifida halotolerans]UOE18772.1 DUF3618 domain-containing protein [Thermobifida halotolerans]